MTRRVVAVRKDASYKEMAAMLRSKRISAFPVVDDQNRVIGVISESDLLVKEADLAESQGVLRDLWRIREHDKAAAVTAADLMTAPAVTIGPDEPVEQAARRMRDHKVKRLPVVTAGGLLVGIVSGVDVLSVFDRPDDEIRAEVLHRVLPEVMPAGSAKLGVVVRDGIVTVSGGAPSEATGHAIMTAIQHIVGVVAVRDRLSYPASGSQGTDHERY